MACSVPLIILIIFVRIVVKLWLAWRCAIKEIIRSEEQN